MIKHHIQVYTTAFSADDSIEVQGDMLIINGEIFYFSAIPVGGQAIPSGNHPFLPETPITRDEDGFHYSLIVRFDSKTAEPDQSRDPAEMLVVIEDQPLPDLVLRKTEEEPEEESEEEPEA